MREHVAGCKIEAPAHRGVCRDGRDMPRIVTPDGKVRSYARTSNYGKVLEDLNALMDWKCRMTAIGFSLKPHLLDKVVRYREDRDRLQKVVYEALDTGGANVQSERGTKVHGLSELVDQAKFPKDLPPEDLADLKAYRNTLDEHGVNPLMIEAFCVQDDLKCAGTFDRLVEIDGVQYIADLKTSATANYPHSWAIQLAIYARSELYDPLTAERTPFDADHNRAVLIHLPAKSGECNLYFIDIAAGWEAATNLVPATKAWRYRKDLLERI